MEAGVLRRIVSRAIRQKRALRLSREKSTAAAGSRDSRYDGVALPGTTRHWTQAAQEACGRLERSAFLRRWMRWRVDGLSCAEGSPSFGAWPTRGHMRATRRLPGRVKARKGPISTGRSRGQNEQVPEWLIVLITVSSTRHNREKCLKPRSRPESRQHRFQQRGS